MNEDMLSKDKTDRKHIDTDCLKSVYSVAMRLASHLLIEEGSMET